MQSLSCCQAKYFDGNSERLWILDDGHNKRVKVVCRYFYLSKKPQRVHKNAKNMK